MVDSLFLSKSTIVTVLVERYSSCRCAASFRSSSRWNAGKALMKILADLGIARELTGRKRNRVFVYDAYLKILNEGTEPS